MTIFIRCDGGAKLGTGHIIRQLMIAKELKRIIQTEIEFLMKDVPEGISRVEKVGIGAGGLTQYEFVSIGLPAFIICENVQHQYELANWFENKGALINLGMGEHISEEIIAFRIKELLNNHVKRQKMSKTAKMLCDGKGLKRTVNKILEVLQ